MLAKQLDEAVAHASLGISLTISLEVTKVTDMAFTVRWGTVGLAKWVVWNNGCQPIDPDLLWDSDTYSEDRRWCIRWCCHRTDGCAFHARRLGRGR